jgi:hypothetical protein
MITRIRVINWFGIRSMQSALVPQTSPRGAA